MLSFYASLRFSGVKFLDILIFRFLKLFSQFNQTLLEHIRMWGKWGFQGHHSLRALEERSSRTSNSHVTWLITSLYENRKILAFVVHEVEWRRGTKLTVFGIHLLFGTRRLSWKWHMDVERNVAEKFLLSLFHNEFLFTELKAENCIQIAKSLVFP